MYIAKFGGRLSIAECKHSSFVVYIGFMTPTFWKLHCYEFGCNKKWQSHQWQAKIGGLYLSVLANWTFQCFPEIKSNPSFISSFFACSFVSLWQPGLVNAIFNVKATIIDSKQKAHLNYRAIEYKTKTKSRQFISFANPINFVFINMIILIKAKICPYLSL